ncbi:glycosyltransferase family 2 protein [Sclerotinia borealis F-4128]|uniref:Glycosyltransferase family 2 protein n=1 Tax=Sclerotinia borealis (strain F-4128) TaxID=1432307 RepID=W9CDF2_SCLBF|nr:glycosyltransferase family 2 protein [Sclerotinia borealis F-4128]
MGNHGDDMFTIAELPTYSSPKPFTLGHDGSPGSSISRISKDAIVNIHDARSSASQSSIGEKQNASRFSVQEEAATLPSHGQKPKTSTSLGIRNNFGRCSNFIHEWTPCLLVNSYFVSSIFAYMLFPTKLLEVFWFIYNFTNFIIAASTALEAFISMEPSREARVAVTKAAEKGWKFPTPDDELLILDMVIVAYLPNEKDIIMDRINYACTKLEYPADKIRINIVYNTPVPILPLEDEMWEAAAKYPQLRIIKVEGSTSKADNLNYYLSLDTGSDITAVYDCDHYMHPHGPRWAIERFMKDKEKVDIVQGRCIVFNTGASFLTSLISIEFDKIYAVSHPGRATIWGFGLFTGSNGFWRTPLLREMKMDETMLTEDIDSALRVVARGCNTVHDLNVVSYELAPTTFGAFWKQRLRWAQGWAQASLKHSILTFNQAKQGKRIFTTRFGLLNLLLIRELSYYLVTQFACLVASFILLNFPLTPAAFWKTIFFQYPISEWFFFVSIFCLIATLWITNQVKSEYASRWMIVKFSIAYPFYLLFLATIGLFGHARQLVKYSSWNPTARA